MRARTIRIFMPEGSPVGLRTAEIGMSTVKAVACSRTEIGALAKRPESGKTGVYVLIGPDDKMAGRNAVYIGEGDAVMDRIYSHDSDPSKEFFERLILFVSKDDSLTKGHVRWLEARLVQLAKSAKVFSVKNGTTPVGGSLPEADAAEMQEFLDQAVLLSAALGSDVFTPAAAVLQTAPISASVPEVSYSGAGFAAQAVLVSGSVIVRKDSMARTKETPSLNENSKILRAQMIESGVLVPTSDGLQFTQDYAFTSPSGAGQVIAGMSVNGWDVWKLPSGEPLSTIRSTLTG